MQQKKKKFRQIRAILCNWNTILGLNELRNTSDVDHSLRDIRLHFKIVSPIFKNGFPYTVSLFPIAMNEAIVE